MRKRSKLYDVTYRLHDNLPVWPGDPKIVIERSRYVDGANVVNTTRLELPNHVGTHVDAPRHMLEDGATLDDIPIERWMGPARVVEIDAPSIGVAQLEALELDGVTKLLFKTRSSGKLLEPTFDPNFVALEPAGARWVVAHGIDLVGIDYASIEAFDSSDFATHHTLLGAEVLIIEGLDLRQVPPGDYELMCFPLRLAEGDGAPARVVLKTPAEEG